MIEHRVKGSGRADDREQLVKAAVEQLAKFGRQLGELTLANVAATSALIAVFLYVIGLLRRVAQLHAEGVATTRGLGLSSLQDYLIQGLAVIVNPETAALLLVILVASAGAFFLPRLTSLIPDSFTFGNGEEGAAPKADALKGSRGESPEGQAVDGALTRDMPKWLVKLFVYGAIAFFVLLVPLAVWAPFAAGLAALAGLWYANSHYDLLTFGSWRTWTTNHASATVIGLGGSLAVVAALYGYCDPPPLDSAVIHTVQGKQIVGKLLAESNGLVYLVGARDRNGRATIEAVSLTDIAAMNVTAGKSRFYKTVPELLELPEELHMRFWRVERDAHGNWYFARTRTNRSSRIAKKPD